MQRTEPLTPVHRTPYARRSREMALVLRARGMPFVERQVGGEHVILVPESIELDAVREIDQYDRENSDWPPRGRQLRLLSSGVSVATAWALVPTLVYLLESTRTLGFDWKQRGLSAAVRVRDGELYRSITALTLHADPGHLLSNIVFGSIVVVLLAQLVGSGVAVASILAAGTLGNFLNAMLQSATHASLGASTAVFGTIGLLVGQQLVRRHRERTGRLYRLAPPLFGLVFLGFLGMGGERTDVLAHVTGFIAGLALGVPLGYVEPERMRNAWLQGAFALGAALALVGAWALALRG